MPQKYTQPWVLRSGMAQKNQLNFTHPVKYSFTQLEKPRKTWVIEGFIQKSGNLKINLQSTENFDLIMILWTQICEKTMLLIISTSQNFYAVKSVHVNYIIPQIWLNMAEI